MARWALVENDAIQELHDALPQNWRNVSGLNLSANDLDFLQSLGWVPVVQQGMDFDHDTKRVSGYQHELDGLRVIETPVLEDRPPPEINDAGPESPSISPEIQNACDQYMISRAPEIIRSSVYQLPLPLWHEADFLSADLVTLRKNRNLLLQNSDFSQLPDAQQYMSSDMIAAWQTYRQTLRDLPVLREQRLVEDWPRPPHEE